MNKKLKNLFVSFFAKRLTRQVKELYSSTLLFNFAVSAVSIFEPVFIYLLFIDQYGLKQTLQLVMLFYLAVYVIYLFFIPIGAKFAKRFGYEYCIAVGTVFTALFYLTLFLMKVNLYFAVLAVVFYVFQKSFYWPAYHGNFAHFSVDGEQGREVGNLVVLQSIVLVTAPLVGGFILKIYDFNVLFFFAGLLMVLSNIPMLLTKEEFVRGDFAYRESFKRLFDPSNRRSFLALLGFGEELIAWTIWPIFIFVVVKDFFSLGLLTSISILFTTLIFLYIGRATDVNSKAVLKLGTFFYFISWLLRVATRSIFGVFLVDFLGRTSKQAIAIPITAITYEKAQDGSVMNNIVFFEMALVVGKIIAIILALVLLQLFVPGWNSIFIASGLMTLLYLFFRK